MHFTSPMVQVLVHLNSLPCSCGEIHLVQVLADLHIFSVYMSLTS
jgi:hypothetical protein